LRTWPDVGTGVLSTVFCPHALLWHLPFLTATAICRARTTSANVKTATHLGLTLQTLLHVRRRSNERDEQRIVRQRGGAPLSPILVGDVGAPGQPVRRPKVDRLCAVKACMHPTTQYLLKTSQEWEPLCHASSLSQSGGHQLLQRSCRGGGDPFLRCCRERGPPSPLRSRSAPVLKPAW
jgi:hypothetical protein